MSLKNPTYGLGHPKHKLVKAKADKQVEPTTKEVIDLEPDVVAEIAQDVPTKPKTDDKPNPPDKDKPKRTKP